MFLKMYGTKLMLAVFLFNAVKDSHEATFTVLSPTSLTTIIGAMPQFKVSVTSYNTTFETFNWLVDGKSSAQVSVTNNTITNTTSESGYSVSVSLTPRNITMNFTMNSTNTANGTFLVQIKALDGTEANFTWNNLNSCGSPPSSLNSTCATYKCNATITTGRCMQEPFIYSCYNTSECTESASWSAPQKILLKPVGCKDSTKWGENCTMTCNEGCSSPCNFTNGACTCKPGYKGNLCNEVGCKDSTKWGENCTMTCNEGCSLPCNFTNGACTCKPGYKGDLCNEVGCKNSTKWGENCTKTCNEGCSSPCNFTNGACTCKPGYKGDLCNEVGCKDSTKWGENCTMTCNEGCSLPCNFTNGACTCKPGYKGDLCNEVGCIDSTKWGENCTVTCNEGCTLPCNFTNGACACKPGYKDNLCNECIPGRYGINCDANCSVGCPNLSCSKDNGFCANTTLGNNVTGCLDNYTGSACNEVICPAGMYGKYCNMSCSIGCPTNTCESENGNCANTTLGNMFTGCKPSYMGVDCTQRGCVNNQTWGETCSMVCGYGCTNNHCNWTTGSCLINTDKCLDGYKQDPENRCTKPICDEGCNGGKCVAPNLCQLCPPHYASGKTCRNIRLDGFLKGSLPTFAILAGVVILLSVTSKWYIRRKIKTA